MKRVMSIKFLSYADFVTIGTRQKTLGIKLQGNIFIFFKMRGCNNCAEFEPVFAQLAKTENRVACAILDVTDPSNREVVKWSRDTSTPITAVPVLILYVNGRPHAKFHGTKSIPSIQGFITKALQTNTSAPSQSFMPSVQTNMYGGGAAPPPNYGGQQEYGPPQPQGGRGKTYTPEIGNAPSLKGVIKGYAAGNNVEDDEDFRLATPDTVIPHNCPWEGGHE